MTKHQKIKGYLNEKVAVGLVSHFSFHKQYNGLGIWGVSDKIWLRLVLPELQNIIHVYGWCRNEDESLSLWF